MGSFSVPVQVTHKSSRLDALCRWGALQLSVCLDDQLQEHVAFTGRVGPHIPTND